MDLSIIFGILLVHWIADFVLQTDDEAKGKSKSWGPLLQHTFKYSLVWLIVMTMHTKSIEIAIFFSVITFFVHTGTDYITSRINSKLWAKGDTHNFFVSIGFDQWLHYVQLFLTYQYVIQ